LVQEYKALASKNKVATTIGNELLSFMSMTLCWYETDLCKRDEFTMGYEHDLGSDFHLTSGDCLVKNETDPEMLLEMAR